METLPDFRFSLSSQPARELPGGIAKEATVEEFPVSKNLAGVFMKLKPGALRELHWHANAAEWAYMIAGNARITIYAPDGTFEVADFGPGDVWYFPRGHGHVIQGMGEKECTFLLVFDNGAFSEFATFSLTDWLAQTPKELLAKNLGLTIAELSELPNKEVYIAQGPDPDSVISSSSSLSHKFRLESQEGQSFAGGRMRIVSQREFPISTTMTGALLDLHPKAFRELHWHPNADEWQYVVHGRAQLTVFASSGLASVVELNAGDVGYVPMGYGHSILNIGNDPLRMVIVLNSGNYEEVSLTGWLAAQPKDLLRANLNLSEDAVRKLPKSSVYIGT